MSDHQDKAEERAETAGGYLGAAKKKQTADGLEGLDLILAANAEATLSIGQRLAALDELLAGVPITGVTKAAPLAGAMPGAPASSEPATLQQGDGPVVELGSGLSSDHYRARNKIRNELQEAGQELPSVEQATADVAAATAAATKAAEKAEKARELSKEADEDERRARIKLELATEAAIEKAGA